MTRLAAATRSEVVRYIRFPIAARIPHSQSSGGRILTVASSYSRLTVVARPEPGKPCAYDIGTVNHAEA